MGTTDTAAPSNEGDTMKPQDLLEALYYFQVELQRLSSLAEILADTVKVASLESK